jgi:BirA family biotin operon repressor/biotin-[acetyl-CoA-carboxylase] ligase
VQLDQYLLLERARQGAPGALLVADRQTAGRGRRGRSWLSSPEAGLTFSLLWRFPGDDGAAGRTVAGGRRRWRTRSKPVASPASD